MSCPRARGLLKNQRTREEEEREKKRKVEIINYIPREQRASSSSSPSALIVTRMVPEHHRQTRRTGRCKKDKNPNEKRRKTWSEFSSRNFLLFIQKLFYKTLSHFWEKNKYYEPVTHKQQI